MPDKEGSDDEKTTKDVVNKKQKQMMNKEEYAIEMVRKIKKKINPKAVFPPIAQNKVKGEIIKGDDLKIDNKNPVKKKMQKNNLDEEGYDIARDMGRVPKTKDKRDASSYPVSKEVRNMKGDTPMQKEFKKKYGKKATALDAVKQKYKDQMMDVKKEELDLTKIAEAFGGYLIEISDETTNKQFKKSSKKNVEPEFKGIEKIPVTKKEPIRVSDPNFQRLLSTLYGTKTSSQIDAEILKRRTPTDIAARELAQRRKADLPVVKKVLQKTAKKAGVPDIFTNKQDTKIDTTKPVRDEKGNIIANPPEPTEKQTDRKRQQVKQDAYSKPETARKGETVVNQGEFSTRTGVVGRGGVEVTSSKGDGRKAGRTKQERKTGEVTYKTPDKITSGKGKQTYDTTSLQGPKRARSKTAAQNRMLQKIRVATRGAKRPVQRVIKPAAAAVGKGSLATLKKIVKNPVGTAIAAGIARDSFRGIPLPQAPRVSGGKVGRRTAG